MGTGTSIAAIRLQSAGEDLVLHIADQVRRDIDVLFICDEWGSSRGGLSTFNREFAVHLAKASSEHLKIHCYVCSSSEEDRQNASEQGVNLITATRLPGSVDPMEGLKILPLDLPHPHVVVGHGRKFGSAARFISERAKCRWVQFVHVFCEALGKYKLEDRTTSDAIAAYEVKHRQELELCKAADLVVAVGSQLQRKYDKMLPDIKVESITPGIFEKFVIQESDECQPKEADEFSVFVFGRGSLEDFKLKGYDIIANAVALLERNFELTFVGSPQDEQRKIEKWFLKKTSIKQEQLTIRRYCDCEEMKKMFREADVVVMPSRTEGFGLVALEAISSGVPVLVSRECGIAKALENLEDGTSVVVNSNNPLDWARKIYRLSKLDPEERHARAITRRNRYDFFYDWQEECQRFEEMIYELVQSSHRAVPLTLSLADQDGGEAVKVEAIITLGDKEAKQMNKKEVPTLTESPQPLRSRRFHRSGSRREEYYEEECCGGEVLATESPQPLRSRRFHRSGSRREEHCEAEEECCGGEVLATDQSGNTVSPFPSMETGLERSIQEFSFDYTPMSLPEYWSTMESEEVQTVPLDANSPEFLQVAGLFYRTADNSFVITRIDRVQNPYLYRSYMVRKQKMDKDSGRNCERLLFHGTSRDSANRINTQGFDRAFHGESAGTSFGRGTYFARDASYSLGYTNPADEEKCMYLARVLVWRFCQGNPKMRAPPPINPHRPEILYDSTVDKTLNPSIFVVFADNQSYPEYLISYR